MEECWCVEEEAASRCMVTVSGEAMLSLTWHLPDPGMTLTPRPGPATASCSRPETRRPWPCWDLSFTSWVEEVTKLQRSAGAFDPNNYSSRCWIQAWKMPGLQALSYPHLSQGALYSSAQGKIIFKKITHSS